MNPTTLPHATFVDHIPLVRAIARGVTDGYPRRHYEVMHEAHAPAGLLEDGTTAPPHPLVGASIEPHEVFLHNRYAFPPESETPAEHEARDGEHRAAALDAISP